MEAAGQGRAAPGEGRAVVKRRKKAQDTARQLGRVLNGDDIPRPDADPADELAFDVQPTGRPFFGMASDHDSAAPFFTGGGWCGTRHRE